MWNFPLFLNASLQAWANTRVPCLDTLTLLIFKAEIPVYVCMCTHIHLHVCDCIHAHVCACVHTCVLTTHWGKCNIKTVKKEWWWINQGIRYFRESKFCFLFVELGIALKHSKIILQLCCLQLSINSLSKDGLILFTQTAFVPEKAYRIVSGTLAASTCSYLN